MLSATMMLEAAAPLLGKRGPAAERRECFETLRTHWLESMDACDPPTATTDEQRRSAGCTTRKECGT